MAGFDQGIKVFFGGDTTQLRSSIGEANTLIQGFGKAVKAVTSGFVGALAVGTLLKGFTAAINSAQELRDKAAEAGTAVDAYTNALAQSGDAIDEIGKIGVKVFGAIANTIQTAVIYFSQFVVGVDVAADAYKRLNDEASKGVAEKQAKALKELAEASTKGIIARSEGEKKLNEIMKEQQKQLDIIVQYGAKSLEGIAARKELITLETQEVQTRAAIEKKEAEDKAKADREAKKNAESLKDIAEKRRDFEREGKPIVEQIKALKEEELQLTIDLNKKGISTEESIEKQNRLLEVQGALRTVIVDKAREAAELEERQQEASQAVNKAIAAGLTPEEQAQIKAYYLGGKKGAAPVISRQGSQFATSDTFKNASPKTLAEVIRREKQNLQFLTPAYGQFGIGADLSRMQIQSRLNAAQKEQDFRNKLGANFALGGEDFARRQFQGDPLAFDKLRDQLIKGQSVAEKSADSLKNIEEALTRRGILTFPAKNLPTGP